MATRRATWIRRFVAATCLVLLLATGAILAAPTVVRWHGERLVEESKERWRADGRDLDAALARYPFRRRNASADELERLAASVGLPLGPKGSARRRALDRSSGDAIPHPLDRDTRSELRSWMHDVLHGEQSASAPPASLTRHLATHASRWKEIEDQLRRGTPPTWNDSLVLGLDSLMPNDALSLIALGDVLLARALVAAAEGRSDAALRSLDAAWRLSRALWSHAPQTLGVLERHDALLAAVARRVRPLPREPWLERFARATHQERAADALTLQAALMARTTELARDDPHRFDALVAPFRDGRENFVPRALAWDMEEARQVVAAIDRNVPCSARETSRAVSSEPNPVWSALGASSLDSPSEIVDRAWDADVQFELTARVIEARASSGDVGELRLAVRCPDDHFVLEVLPDGGFRVERHGPGARPGVWPDSFRAPLVHVEPPPAP